MGITAGLFAFMHAHKQGLVLFKLLILCWLVGCFEVGFVFFFLYTLYTFRGWPEELRIYVNGLLTLMQTTASSTPKMAAFLQQTKQFL